MKAYILEASRLIAPFGEPASAMPIGNRTLKSIQDRLLKRYGLTPVRVKDWSEVDDSEDRAVLLDDLWFTRRVLKTLLKYWRRDGKPPVQLALPNKCFVQEFADVDPFEMKDGQALFQFYLLPAGASHKDAKPLEPLYKEKVIELPMPERMVGVSVWRHPITTSVALHLRHWLHVLAANRLAIQVAWVDAIMGRPWWGLWLVFKGLLPGRGSLFWRLFGRANKIGKNVSIHPSAIIEGSFIGDNVRIGAHALVRGSLIAAGTTLEDRVNIAFSVIGARCYVSKHTLIYTSALMEEVNVGSALQMCLVGRKVGITPRVTPMDVMPKGKLRVKDGDRLVEVSLPVLGSCFGHDVFLGPDVYVAPGRALPNGLTVLSEPARILASVPDEIDPNLSYVVRDGTLVPR